MSTLSLADAKTHLNISGSSSDVELQTFIDTAEAVIASRVGPLTPGSQTSEVPGGTDTLALPVRPVTALTSVTPSNATALTVGDLRLHASTGLVTWAYGGTFSASTYTVVYTAGRATVPADLLMAIKEEVRHLWRSQRGTASRPGSSDSDTVPGYLMPYKVAELLAPYVQAGLS